MWLNILSGRSYKDVNKYPIFPWPIIDYTSKIINKLSTRNFDKPMGMLTMNNQSALRKRQLRYSRALSQQRGRTSSFEYGQNFA